MYLRTGGADPGRDGCRVPLPWSGTRAPYGFSPASATAEPWLPQPADWADRTVEAQTGDPASMLELYRTALRLRRGEAGLGDGPMEWLDSPPDILAFRRDGDFTCVVNLSAASTELPPHREVLLASGPLENGTLPPDTAVWLRA